MLSMDSSYLYYLYLLLIISLINALSGIANASSGMITAGVVQAQQLKLLYPLKWKFVENPV